MNLKNNLKNTSVCLIRWIFLVLLMAGPAMQAAPFTWDGGGNGSSANLWSAKQNWGNSGPPAVADIANFGTVIPGNSVTPLVNSAAAISNIFFNSGATAFTLGGTALLTVGGSIQNNSSAVQTINSSLALARSQSWAANSGALVFGGPINNAGFALTINGAASTTINGIVSGAGSLIKNGGGTLSLTQSNTYSGGTTVGAGLVLVNNTTGSGTGSGSVVVNGGTFGGTGRITGGLTLNSGSRISAGNSTGANRISTFMTGNETWNGGAGMNWEINDVASGAGTGWDFLSINGTLTINATSLNQFTINIASLTLANTAGNVNNFNSTFDPGYTWNIVSTTGGITGFDANAFALDLSGFSNPLLGSSQFFISLVDGGNGLAITYVPEPSTIALGLIGAGVIMVGFFRRSKQR